MEELGVAAATAGAASVSADVVTNGVGASSLSTKVGVLSRPGGPSVVPPPPAALAERKKAVPVEAEVVFD